ncbi:MULTISPECIES: YusW family protein [Rummeliibacillus]|jgi:hypothetical protein|uniref:YusW family protein n=1 Tax=Rummeliibacillus TaxID=648802 RepID=UPI0011B7FC7F|nr:MULTISPECIES: YusW family protein [Rummeliibacillus]MBO2536638.1 YusW family protein [Rummeliibacillus suwonensis]
MKKIFSFLPLCLLTILLFGCGANDDNATNVDQNAPVSESGANEPTETQESTDNNDTVTDDTTDTTDDTTAGTAFPFSEFSLNVDYGANQAYKVDYENEKDGSEATVEKERENQKIEGNEAYAQLEPLFKRLTFTDKTSDEEVKKEIISVFNIDDTYKKINLEVKFSNGTEKTYTFTP